MIFTVYLVKKLERDFPKKLRVTSVSMPKNKKARAYC
ncbi:hypothetical protein SAMN05216353_12541 [Halobacillus alkaliphilus]|uniref:Uncharacterized protein n=1 Tax=Halobacillus alkaliphilus TaxID=396056 RepID=A0A1I2PP84_9BACI|nr:hypothetical protein SAMN05216353_12541 [Halobacillus alkaliphilus]